jgi:hypothetical protein
MTIAIPTITHIPVAVTLEIDLAKPGALSMQGIFDAIQAAYPNDPSLSVAGIGIPLLNIGCKEFGVIDPINDIKEAVARMYDYCMKGIVQPIWDAINGIYNKLAGIMKTIKKAVQFPTLDLKLPIFDLHISDLFSKDLYATLVTKLTELYNTNRDKLAATLKKLNIPYPLFTDIQSPEKEIASLVKHVQTSLWDSLFRVISTAIKYIKLGVLAATAFINPSLAVAFNAAIDAAIGKFLSFFIPGMSIQDLHDAIIKYATAFYKRIPTYADIMAIIEKFKLPIIGFPLDWKLPINLKVVAPNIDFIHVLGDMKIWLNNFVVSLLKKLVDEFNKILAALKLPKIALPKIRIPITLCAIQSSQQLT